MNLAIMTPLAIAIYLNRAALPKRPLIGTLIALLILTLIFNTFIIAADISEYNQKLLLPVRIINIPPEDFAYSIVAAIFIPYIWSRLGQAKAKVSR